jgi:sucrose-6-phosphate hydrolase SacC (GH32 family)
MTFKELLALKNIQVYHGSDILVREPKIMQPVRALDFGHGFYTTTNIEQAKSFAKKVQDRNGSSQTHISIFILNMDLLKKKNALFFDKPDKKWLDFVSANRNGTYSGQIYDIVYGPVANDTIFRTFIAYQNGVLNEKETLKRLKIRRLYNQLVFTNDEALKCLLFSGEF